MDDSIHNLRDALEWLDRRIREEAELDGEMSNDHAIQLGFITNMLEKFPLRECDVGTAEEQGKRFQEFCDDSQTDEDFCSMCARCSLKKEGHCEIVWAQMPYKEVGAK